MSEMTGLFMIYLSLKVMLSEANDTSTIFGATSLLTLKRSDLWKSEPPPVLPETWTSRSWSPVRTLPV
jgi:hypothetical protein